MKSILSLALLTLTTAVASGASLQSDQEIIDEFNRRSGLHCDNPVLAQWTGEMRYRGIFVFTGANVIYLRSDLEGEQRRRVLFHELAHCGLRTRDMGFYQEELAAQTLEKALIEGFYEEKALSCYGNCNERDPR